MVVLEPLVADCWESGGPDWIFGWMLSAGFTGFIFVMGWTAAAAFPSTGAPAPGRAQRALGVVPSLLLALVLGPPLLSTAEGREQLVIASVLSLPCLATFIWAIRVGGLGRMPVPKLWRLRVAYFAPLVLGTIALMAAAALFVAQMLLGRPC